MGAEPYVRFFAPDPSQFPNGSIDQENAKQVIRQGLAYFEINAITFCTQVIIIVLGNGFRGGGDFLTPVKLMVAAVLINLVLDPLLIFGLGGLPELGLAGAAWATVIAQVLALIGYAIILLRPSNDDRSVRLGTPVLDRDFFIRLLTKGTSRWNSVCPFAHLLGIDSICHETMGTRLDSYRRRRFRGSTTNIIADGRRGSCHCSDRWTELWRPPPQTRPARQLDRHPMVGDLRLCIHSLVVFCRSVPGTHFCEYWREPWISHRFTTGGPPPLSWPFRLASYLHLFFKP